MDLILKIDGDWSKYQLLQSFMLRMAKQEDSEHEAADYRRGYYGSDELCDDDYAYHEDDDTSSWDEWYEEHWSGDDYNIDTEDYQWTDDDWLSSEDYYGKGKKNKGKGR